MIRQVIERHRDDWKALKYQTEHGPESAHFPFYPAAVEFEEPARRVITSLSADQKGALIAEWNRQRIGTEPIIGDEILSQYASLVLDEVVQRARSAAARTWNWQ